MGGTEAAEVGAFVNDRARFLESLAEFVRAGEHLADAFPDETEPHVTEHLLPTSFSELLHALMNWRDSVQKENAEAVQPKT